MNSFVWLGVALVAGIAEVISFGLITMWFVVGALAAFVANLLGADLTVQIIVFIAVSVVCLVVLRPVVLKYRRSPHTAEPDVVGSTALVVEAIDNAAHAGRVETPDHMTWAAKSADGAPIEQGETVAIVGRESIVLVVERKQAC